MSPQVVTDRTSATYRATGVPALSVHSGAGPKPPAAAAAYSDRHPSSADLTHDRTRTLPAPAPRRRPAADGLDHRRRSTAGPRRRPGQADRPPVARVR